MFDFERWTDDDLRRLLQTRQEFFLDPMGSNKQRFLEAAKLLEIAKSIYGEGHAFRFKPKYYPYTEPSVGMDMQCTVCLAKSESCPTCKGAGWITILGSGMIHPKVFIEFGYDHTKVSGIAFGIGSARIAAQASGLTTLKPLYDQDLRVHRTVHRGGM